MSYREPQEALRAELALAREEQATTRRERSAIDQKLARAEKALAAYRKTTGTPVTDGARGARILVGIGVALWGSAIVAAIQDNHDLARVLAVAFTAFALFAPLGVWAAVQRLGTGIVFVCAKIILPLGVANLVTFKRAARSHDIDSLFWWGPVVLLCVLLFESVRLVRPPERRP